MSARVPGRREIRYRPLVPSDMARICRRLARDMRTEAEMKWPPIALAYTNVAGEDRGSQLRISRAEAAVSMEAQADRWDAEAKGGPRNERDRARIGW